VPFSVKKESPKAMSKAPPEPPQNLLAFTLDALRNIGGQHPLSSPHRNTWSDSHTDLYDSELEFLPYRPAAGALSDWFYEHDLILPAGFPRYPFRHTIEEREGRVLLHSEYRGSDPELQARALSEIEPDDVTEALKAVAVPRIGVDCTDLFTPFAAVLQQAKGHQLDFKLDPSPMGGSYLRFTEVEKALNHEQQSERLYSILFCILINRSIDAGGLAPYTTYSLCLVDGHIRLQCTPDHASAIPDDIKEEVLAETKLPERLETEIDMTESASWILMELEVEAPEIYAEIEKEALARTIADFTMDLDLTDLLKGTPDLPLYP
jgi:hypothetical protein